MKRTQDGSAGDVLAPRAAPIVRAANGVRSRFIGRKRISPSGSQTPGRKCTAVGSVSPDRVRTRVRTGARNRKRKVSRDTRRRVGTGARAVGVGSGLLLLDRFARL